MLKLGCKSHFQLQARASQVSSEVLVVEWIRHDFKSPSSMTARLPKVGQLVGAQPEEKQKEGGSWLGVQG